MLKQLLYEIREIRKTLKANFEHLESIAPEADTLPLLSTLETTVHAAKLAEIILLRSLADHAQKFIYNCDHYNRIIDWAEKAFYFQKSPKALKACLANLRGQGHLIFNSSKDPVGVDDGTRKFAIEPGKGYLTEYEEALHVYLGKQRNPLKRIPRFRRKNSLTKIIRQN
jgi:hypothetical protein